MWRRQGHLLQLRISPVHVTTAEREMTRPASKHCSLRSKPTTTASGARVTPAASDLAPKQSEVTTCDDPGTSATGTDDIAVI
jgi:hypothetical protein